MIGRRFGSILLLAVAATVPMPSVASSHSPISSFAPRSSLAAETSLLKKNQVVLTDFESLNLATRGGGDITPPNQVVSALGLFAINFAVTKVFAALDIEFPAMLGGCVILFTFLLLADSVKSGLGNDIYEWLTPGGNLVAKWLPVFFVPGLAMLPRAPSLGSGVDVRSCNVCNRFCRYLNAHLHRIFLSCFSGPQDLCDCHCWILLHH